MNTDIINERMAAIFNEWIRRYEKNTDEFDSLLDSNGKAPIDYGNRCAIYFHKIAAEMDANDQLPKFVKHGCGNNCTCGNSK